MRSSNVLYVLVLILSLVKESYPMLKLYNNHDEEITSFHNVDLSITDTYTQVTGNLFIASFQTGPDPCIVREIPEYDDNKDLNLKTGKTTDTAIIITPTLNDTTSVTNDQEPPQTALPNNTLKAIIFSSSHNGIPGIREQYKGDIKILRTATLIITLINCEDIDDLIKIANDVAYVNVTANEGPWIEFMKSETWKVFSIVIGLLDLLLVMIIIYLIPKTYVNLGCALCNPKYWIYPALGIIIAFSFILLELDPGDIYQDKLAISTKGFFYCLKKFLTGVSYTILYMSWMIVTRNICREKIYKPFLLVEISKFFKVVPPMSVSAFTLCFILRLSYKDKAVLPPIIVLFKILFIIESIALGLVGLGFLVFGIFIIFALKGRGRKWNSIQTKKQLFGISSNNGQEFSN
ncbi:2097_t:CDS:2 [Funneliformis mosseae]|uniref:2097_t:CDS:1 n=1 Tax=Funneliformis mosseae TaxID=27381 RepID=A0A9N9FH53_FUNMO|nr:2097_t:CDS:2 [Funneliformis mosseae]